MYDAISRLESYPPTEAAFAEYVTEYDYRSTQILTRTTTAMRYYEQRYPEVDELVMVQVRQIAEMGAYVKLVSVSTHAQTTLDAPRSSNTTISRE